jgi:hypothetical protein
MSGGHFLVPELEKFWRTDDGLTAAERAAAYGIDLSLIEDNLRLTAAERMERNEAALALMRSLEKPLECDAGA